MKRKTSETILSQSAPSPTTLKLISPPPSWQKRIGMALANYAHHGSQKDVDLYRKTDKST